MHTIYLSIRLSVYLIVLLLYLSVCLSYHSFILSLSYIRSWGLELIRSRREVIIRSEGQSEVFGAQHGGNEEVSHSQQLHSAAAGLANAISCASQSAALNACCNYCTSMRKVLWKFNAGEWQRCDRYALLTCSPQPSVCVVFVNGSG